MHQKRIATTALCVLAISCTLGFAVDPAPKQTVTLLGMLSEWSYPDSKFNGTEMSDGGVKDIYSIKCKAVLTTSDPAEKVFDFYLKQLKVDSSGKNLVEKDGERIKTERAVTVQDDSIGRPLKLYVISVNEIDWSTTLVISRAEGEETTHIAWSNFRHLSP